MIISSRILLTIFLTFLLNATAAVSQDEMAGAADHPDVPRITGSVLVGYDKQDFDEGAFLVPSEDENTTVQYAEGQTTKLIYAAPEGTSPIEALRNYQEAFEDLGEITEVYSCRRADCDQDIGKDFIWEESARIENNVRNIDYFYSNNFSRYFYSGQAYWYAKIVSDAASYDVSFYAAERTDYLPKRTDLQAGRTLVHIQIVNDESFESDLQFVDAGAIVEGITEKGAIALYGLFFDSGDDQLTAESKPTLAEIAKVLKERPDLDLYVVGHTDTDGTVASNEDLSKRRAASVVLNLTRDYGISGERLVAIGAGLAAPVATNQTEEGKALNRRVELVQR